MRVNNIWHIFPYRKIRFWIRRLNHPWCALFNYICAGRKGFPPKISWERKAGQKVYFSVFSRTFQNRKGLAYRPIAVGRIRWARETAVSACSLWHGSHGGRAERAAVTKQSIWKNCDFWNSDIKTKPRLGTTIRLWRKQRRNDLLITVHHVCLTSWSNTKTVYLSRYLQNWLLE